MSNQVPLNWSKIGTALRESALEAHDGGLPPLKLAYEFLLDNPEIFSQFIPAVGCECVYKHNDGDCPFDREWPIDMPQEPTAELMAAYYCVEVIR